MTSLTTPPGGTSFSLCEFRVGLQATLRQIDAVVFVFLADADTHDRLEDEPQDARHHEDEGAHERVTRAGRVDGLDRGGSHPFQLAIRADDDRAPLTERDQQPYAEALRRDHIAVVLTDGPEAFIEVPEVIADLADPDAGLAALRRRSAESSGRCGR